MSLICDDKIFDSVPVKKEVRATVSGIYITDVKAVRGKLPTPEKKPKGIRGRLQAWRKNAAEKANEAEAAAKKAKKKKS